jgi:copper chaperone
MGPAAGSARGEAVMDHLTLTVKGMSCGGCETAVKRAVSLVEGVSNVTASHRDERVTLDYDPERVTRAAVEKAIRRAGYQVA